MTQDQFERVCDWARRMARTCFRESRRPSQVASQFEGFAAARDEEAIVL